MALDRSFPDDTTKKFAEGGTVSKDITDQNNWSTEQLQHYVATGEEPVSLAAEGTPGSGTMPSVMDPASARYAKVLAAEPGWNRALIGAGKEFADMGHGISDLGELAFSLGGKPGEAIRSRIMQDRQERQVRDRPIEEDPAAISGGVGTQIATSLLAPARLGPQVAMQAGMRALDQPSITTSGVPSELLSRALSGGKAAGLTYGGGKAVQGIGKLAGAVSNQYDAAGAKAMAIRDAAYNELGVKMRLADLDPNSVAGRAEELIPGGGTHVQAQAEALRPHLDASVQVPSSTGASYVNRNVPGEGLRQGLVDAADTLKGHATAKWNLLDDFVNRGALKPVSLAQTSQATRNVSGNSLDLIGEYNPQVANWLGGLQNVPANQLGTIPFASLNEMRMAVGKAVGKVSRDFERIPSTSPERATARQTREELANLYRTINQDLEQWGTANTKNAGAMALFRNANDFYRDRVVPDILGNPVVGKATKGSVAGSNPKAFKDSEDIIRAVTSHPEVTDRLRDSMSPKTAAMIDVLRTAPDAKQYLLSGALPEEASLGGLGTLASLAVGHPLTTAGVLASRVPGLGALAQSRAAQRLHFARDLAEDTPFGKAMYGVMQLPEHQTEAQLSYPFGKTR